MGISQTKAEGKKQGRKTELQAQKNEREGAKELAKLQVASCSLNITLQISRWKK